MRSNSIFILGSNISAIRTLHIIDHLHDRFDDKA